VISIRRIVLCHLLFALSLVACGFGQQFDAKLFQELHWRLIGPFRGGRGVAISGVPGQPNVFYMAPNNGGVWKTTDYGRTWNPIFDDQPTGSVGALAIAPSNPEIIYVGSGEGLRRPDLSTGDGMYKSSDGGRSWQHLGLRDGQQIAASLVDPHDPNRVLVAVLGHPYGPNAERGVFRSTDGGLTWQKVLYKDENTGAIDLAFDPSNSQIVYADMWASRRPPWTTGGAYNGKGSGLYKSADGGNTWRQITKGLPSEADGLGRIGLAVSLSDPDADRPRIRDVPGMEGRWQPVVRAIAVPRPSRHRCHRGAGIWKCRSHRPHPSAGLATGRRDADRRRLLAVQPRHQSER